MTDFFDGIEDATPLEPEEREGLLQSWITTRADLNAAEQDNIDDIQFWADNGTYAPDETAVRLHHRLVFVHPFPNGNGRHARLMADLLIRRLGSPRFTWGGESLQDVTKLRRIYVAALRKADKHDYTDLIAFARS